MNENSWAEWAFGVAIALLGWIGKRLHDRQDRFEQDCVTHEEFLRTVTDMRHERREMHEENSKILDRIHERVDQLWERP